MEKDRNTLSGGREGAIFLQGDRVVRPANPWTEEVQNFLRFLRGRGVDYVPVPYGRTEEGQEVLSFVQGQIFHEGLPISLYTEEFLQSVAKLLSDYHSHSKEYISRLTGKEPWMLSAVEPIEVMCHGDFAPYNVTVEEGSPKGIIDFDTLHPGPAMWDVVYGTYRFVPFMSPTNPEYRGPLKEQIRRMKVFLDAYGASKEQREQFIPLLLHRLTCLIDYMKRQAALGNKDFITNIERGDLKIYLQDMEYIHLNQAIVMKGIN